MIASDSNSTDISETISLVVPVFNEEKGIRKTYSILTDLMESHNYKFEIVISDNGSTDDTEAIVQEIAMQDKRCKYVRLSRNFGYQNNISVGMALANGDAIIVIDSDLQDPPELIPQFINHWKDGYDVVYGVRIKRTEEPRVRVFMTMLAMRIISWLADYPLPPHSADFRLITREVRDAFISMPERSRYVRGMIHWVGFNQVGVPYTRRGRQHGEEDRLWFGTGIISLVGVMMDAIFSFSLKPLRFFFLFGTVITLVTILLGIIYLVLWIFQDLPRGFTTQTLLLLLNLGVMSLGIGVLGEYISRIYMEAKERPSWIIRYTLNFEHEEITQTKNQKKNN